MKKFTYILLAVAAVVALSSCKQKPAPVEEEVVETVEETEAPAEEAPAEEAPAEVVAE